MNNGKTRTSRPCFMFIPETVMTKTVLAFLVIDFFLALGLLQFIFYFQRIQIRVLDLGLLIWSELSLS